MDKKNRGLIDLVSPDIKKLLLEKGTRQNYKKGTVIFTESDNAPLYIILEGFLSLQRTSRNNEMRILLICGRGEAVNELVLENGSSGVLGVALSDIEVLSISKELYEEMALKCPELEAALYASLARKTRRLYHQLGNDYSTYQINNHLVVKIWKLAKDYGIDYENGKLIPFDISVVMLAQLLGAKRETISRAVSKLRENGLIEMENGRLFVRNMDLLREEMKNNKPID